MLAPQLPSHLGALGLLSLSCSAPIPLSPLTVLSPWALSGARGQLFGSLAKGYSAVTSLLLDKLCKLP